MASFDEKPGAPQPTNKEYVDIIYSRLATDQKFIKDTGVPAKIVYYCPECKKLVVPKRIGKKFRFSCPECKCGEVAFGTEQSIGSYYRIKELIKTEIKKSRE